MHHIDHRLYTGLTRMRNAYDALLSIREQVTPAEIDLSDQWQAELEPVLRDLYWWPLRNGIDQAPVTKSELRQWLEDRFTDAAVVTILLLLLLRYQQRAVNIGGTMALDMLSIGGSFRLTDATYLATLDAHAQMLTTPRTEMSLIDTTVDNLITGIQAARKSTESTSLVLGTLIAGWALARSGLIAVTETTRQVGNGLNWTFAENDVRWQEFVTREGACKICSPLHGRRMRVNAIPAELRIPVHTKCRCLYRSVLDGWNRPSVIWTGGNP